MNKEHIKLSKEFIEKLKENNSIMDFGQVGYFFRDCNIKDRTIIIENLKENNIIVKDRKAYRLKDLDTKTISERQWDIIKIIIAASISGIIGYILAKINC